MKSKFEKEFKKQAYNAVPDRWEEVKEKAGVSTPEKKEGKVMKFNAKAIASIAASITIVIVAVSVAVGVGSRKNMPAKSEITVTDENGVSYTLTDVSDFDSIAVPETTVISYKDSNGVEHTTVATITRNAQGQREDSSVVVTFKDAQGNTQTTVVDIPADPSTTKPNGQPSTTKSASADSAPEANPASTAASTRAEVATETDWSLRSMPGKFPAVQFTESGMGREYVFPWTRRDTRTTTRSATRLYSGYTLKTLNTTTDKMETTTADIYALQGFSKKLAVGVQFAGEQKPHIYINTEYLPQTLGEFLSAIDYDNTIRYSNIRLYKDGTFPVNDQNKADIRRYLLSNGSVRNETPADRPLNDLPYGDYVTLTIYCDELGMYNKAMYVYESGYVATNLVGRVYVFNVGKENVAAFLKNSYNVTFDDLAKVGTTLQTTLPDCGGDPPVTTVSQPYFIEGTTATTTQAQTIPE